MLGVCVCVEGGGLVSLHAVSHVIRMTLSGDPVTPIRDQK